MPATPPPRPKPKGKAPRRGAPPAHHSNDRVTPGIPDGGPGGIGSKMVVKTSKKYGGDVAYRKTASGKLMPVGRPDGSALKRGKGTKLESPGPVTTSTTPKDDLTFGKYKDLVDAATTSRFAEDEAALANQVTQTRGHDADIDKVFDQFKASLMGHTQASQGAQQATATALNNATQQATAESAKALGTSTAGAVAADQRTGTQYGDEIAKQAAGAVEGELANAAIGRSELAGIQAANAAALGRMDPIMDLERGSQHAVTQNRLGELGRDQRTLAGKKGAFKLEYLDELKQREGKAAQQDTENDLAAEAIMAGDRKSLRDFRARAADRKAQVQMNTDDNTTATTVASGHDATTDRTNRRTTRTQAENNRRTTQTQAENSRRAARTQKAVAQIKGAATGKDAKKPITMKDSGGRTVTMTPAERKQWTQRRSAAVSGVRDLRSEIAKQGDEDKAVKTVAKRHHIPESVVRAMVGSAKGGTTGDVEALKSYFPGGIVPPGFLKRGGAT